MSNDRIFSDEDKVEFGGNTLLLECKDNEYVYISALEILKFKTVDKILDYISPMGNNMIPYAIRIGEIYTHFVAHYYKFIENDSLLNSPDPIDFHVEKCDVASFKKLERSLIHTLWPGYGEDQDQDQNGDEDEDKDEDDVMIETNYCHGNIEVVKTFNQKCVICLERDSDYPFRQCGHQCICEQCYQKRVDIDILKCVVCRT